MRDCARERADVRRRCSRECDARDARRGAKDAGESGTYDHERGAPVLVLVVDVGSLREQIFHRFDAPGSCRA
eukprot:1160609-Prorocentrum_minimum.AAC.1